MTYLGRGVALLLAAWGCFGCEASDSEVSSNREEEGDSVFNPSPSASGNGAAMGGSASATRQGNYGNTANVLTSSASGGASAASSTATSHSLDTAASGGAAQTGTTSIDRCSLLDSTQPLTLYLSSDDSNSMASPVIARSIINQGGVPPAGLIRTYEFMNYYDLKYERAGAGELALNLEMATGDSTGSYAMQIGVSSEAAAFVRRPMNITFVLDTSGSMSGEPIARSKAAVKAVAASLKQGDVVSAVTWNDTNTIVMDSHIVSGPSDPTVVAMADAMQANGSTNLNAGLTRGYELAHRNFVPEYLNRVVLISDGQANTGVTDESIIAEGASLNDGDGIYLVGVGVGDGVNDTLMNTVTDKGRGAYIYLDGVTEASRMFIARFDESMDVAARAVQVRLDLPWYLGVVQFSGEQMSTNAKAVEPQHLAPNDAMVFEQLLRPCSAESFMPEDTVTVSANWLTPTTHEPRSATLSTTLGTLMSSSANHLPKGRAIVAYADALKAGSTRASIDNALAKVAAAQSVAPDDELSEIDGLLRKLAVRAR
jgi:Ca-activated chloride channel family protein